MVARVSRTLSARTEKRPNKYSASSLVSEAHASPMASTRLHTTSNTQSSSCFCDIMASRPALMFSISYVVAAWVRRFTVNPRVGVAKTNFFRMEEPPACLRSPAPGACSRFLSTPRPIKYPRFPAWNIWLLPLTPVYLLMVTGSVTTGRALQTWLRQSVAAQTTVVAVREEVASA